MGRNSYVTFAISPGAEDDPFVMPSKQDTVFQLYAAEEAVKTATTSITAHNASEQL
jgi:hypothetical protein